MFPTSQNYRRLSFYNHANHTSSTTTTTTGYCTTLTLEGSGFDSNPNSQLKTQFCAEHGYNFCFLFCVLETDVAKCPIRLTMFVRLLACSSWSTVLPHDGLYGNPKQSLRVFKIQVMPHRYCYRLCISARQDKHT